MVRARSQAPRRRKRAAPSGLILDTTFVIDLERERHRGDVGPAWQFLERNAQQPLALTQITTGELACGPNARERADWDDAVAPFRIIPIDQDVCWRYGRIYRHLKTNGQMIGANDLWIAASALGAGLPLVTADVVGFQKVPDLEVVEYR